MCDIRIDRLQADDDHLYVWGRIVAGTCPEVRVEIHRRPTVDDADAPAAIGAAAAGTWQVAIPISAARWSEINFRGLYLQVTCGDCEPPDRAHHYPVVVCPHMQELMAEPAATCEEQDGRVGRRVTFRWALNRNDVAGEIRTRLRIRSSGGNTTQIDHTTPAGAASETPAETVFLPTGSYTWSIDTVKPAHCSVDATPRLVHDSHAPGGTVDVEPCPPAPRPHWCALLPDCRWQNGTWVFLFMFSVAVLYLGLVLLGDTLVMKVLTWAAAVCLQLIAYGEGVVGTLLFETVVGTIILYVLAIASWVLSYVVVILDALTWWLPIFGLVLLAVGTFFFVCFLVVVAVWGLCCGDDCRFLRSMLWAVTWEGSILGIIALVLGPFGWLAALIPAVLAILVIVFLIVVQVRGCGVPNFLEYPQNQ